MSRAKMTQTYGVDITEARASHYCELSNTDFVTNARFLGHPVWLPHLQQHKDTHTHTHVIAAPLPHCVISTETHTFIYADQFVRHAHTHRMSPLQTWTLPGLLTRHFFFTMKLSWSLCNFKVASSTHGCLFKRLYETRSSNKK